MTGEPAGKTPGQQADPPSAGQAGRLRRLLKDRRVRFLMVGAANTAFSTTLFALLVLLTGPRMPAAVNLAIAWSASLVVAFAAYRRLVFHVSGNLARDFARFFSVNVGGLLINAAALFLLVDVGGLPAIPTQLCITVVVVVFNYLGHRHFSFRRRAPRIDGGER